MDQTFRAVPNGTIRLTAATIAGAAPVLAGLPIGGGCTALVQNRGTVPVLVAFGRNAAMDLPVAPSDAVGGARSIPAGGVTLVRLQQGERHVAIAVASGTPDIEFTCGDGGGDVFAVAGSGGTVAQGNAGSSPWLVQESSDASVSTYSLSATGATTGVRTDRAGALVLDLAGTFAATVQIQVSNDSTNGTDGTWTTHTGFYPEDAALSAPTASATSTRRKVIYRAADGIWARLNVTSYTSGPVAASLVLRKAAPSERGVYVGGGAINATLASAGTNRSGTVGTTAANLMAANTSRRGWKVKNDTASDIWINFDTAATAAAGSGNIKIPAGGYLASEPGYVETGAMSAIGAAAGLAITAREH